eukprot:CAMPEP_0114980368 /NCGR_PEP_ID=MMETSP0216-20121206/4924_1 /TAXON_ID=223996 /ORGANISM="Protocruzia adherens, Strain Boccale" /LENGTH=52 /DNA_ID=CAMNT_0002341869 /DNA_START=1298 /DNA_END=1456 /DNA_ORIENTATION=+
MADKLKKADDKESEELGGQILRSLLLTTVGLPLIAAGDIHANMITDVITQSN